MTQEIAELVAAEARIAELQSVLTAVLTRFCPNDFSSPMPLRHGEELAVRIQHARGSDNFAALQSRLQAEQRNTLERAADYLESYFGADSLYSDQAADYLDATKVLRELANRA